MAWLPSNTTISTHADLFREEADRARRHVAAAGDQNVIDQLNLIASLYEKLAAAQHAGPTDRD